MKLEYLGDWREVEGSLRISRILSMPVCLEQKHLLEIWHMLAMEGLGPNDFKCWEYPTEGVYECCRHEWHDVDFFTVIETAGKLVPHYRTNQFDRERINVHPCRTIKEAIEKTE